MLKHLSLLSFFIPCRILAHGMVPPPPSGCVFPTRLKNLSENNLRHTVKVTCPVKLAMNISHYRSTYEKADLQRPELIFLDLTAYD